jgi:hypothetical protein
MNRHPENHLMELSTRLQMNGGKDISHRHGHGTGFWESFVFTELRKLEI